MSQMEEVPSEEVGIVMEEDHEFSAQETDNATNISTAAVPTVTDPFWLRGCMAMSYHNHNPTIVIGPHCMCPFSFFLHSHVSHSQKGPLYLCTVLGIIGLTGSYLFLFLIHKSATLTAIGVVLLLFVAVTYTYTAIMNPGMPNRDLSQYNPEYIESLIKEKSFLYCFKCNVVKNLRVLTMHCEFCDVCVEGYDHHCPWTGKCIGRGNIIPFNMFIGGFLALMIYGILSVVMVV